jgi:dimethylaniline monooxygenase (N-oxide forming)
MFELSAAQREGTKDLSADREVCVIGAGFSGLAAARALRQRGVPFTCVDSAPGVGGVWRSPDAISSPSYRGLHLNTSRAVTAYTGFPMPDRYPRYPDLRQVSAYLNAFADHIEIREDLELDTEVVAAGRDEDGVWNVVTHNRTTGADQHRRFRQIIAATGCHHQPRLPTIPGADSFTGQQIHSTSYVDPRDLAGRRVLVLGIGNSACDIAVEASRVADRTVLAMRRGAHVVPKQLMGIPIDEIAAARWWSWLPFRVQRRFVESLLWIIRGPITSYGIPAPDHRLFSAPVTVSDDLLTRITHGALAVKPMIDRFEDGTLRFADGSREDFDTVIYCTGYDFGFPFLPADCVAGPDGRVALYRRVVPPRYQGTYVMGLVRPIGAITPVIEAQAEWVADLASGATVPPPAEQMWSEIEGYLAGTARRYGHAPGDSIHVDVAEYVRSLRDQRASPARRPRARVPA